MEPQYEQSMEVENECKTTRTLFKKNKWPMMCLTNTSNSICLPAVNNRGSGAAPKTRFYYYVHVQYPDTLSHSHRVHVQSQIVTRDCFKVPIQTLFWAIHSQQVLSCMSRQSENKGYAEIDLVNEKANMTLSHPSFQLFKCCPFMGEVKIQH